MAGDTKARTRETPPVETVGQNNVICLKNVKTAIMQEIV